MRLPLPAATFLIIGIAAATANAAEAPKSVSIEIATDSGLPITASQRWYETLTDLGISGLRICAATSTDKPSVTKLGANGYRVVGVLTGDNRLFLPGGTFRTTDGARSSPVARQIRATAAPRASRSSHRLSGCCRRNCSKSPMI